jgi:hypothetical protein
MNRIDQLQRGKSFVHVTAQQYAKNAHLLLAWHRALQSAESQDPRRIIQLDHLR